jgi:hypothetical protein
MMTANKRIWWNAPTLMRVDVYRVAIPPGEQEGPN